MRTQTSKVYGTTLFFLMMVLSIFSAVCARADAPTYTAIVSVGSGFNLNHITPTQSSTATVNGSLNVNSPNQEYQESGDNWSWSASVTAYAATYNGNFAAVPGGVTPPSVYPSQGSASTTVTANNGLSPGYYQVTVTGTDIFNVTYNDGSDPPVTSSQSKSGSTTLNIAIFTLGPPTCAATAVNPYVILNDGSSCRLIPSTPALLPNPYPDNVGVAVDLKASAGITPTDAPLAWLSDGYPGAQIGLVQNVMNGASYTVTYGNPHAVWNPALDLPAGTVGYASAGWSKVVTVPACVDTRNDGSPYPMPYSALEPISALWEDGDSPQDGGPAVGYTALMAADNTTVLGRAFYSVTNLSLNSTFADWCCIVNGGTSFPATAGWAINVSAVAPAPGNANDTGIYVTPTGGGGSPITSGYDNNQYLEDYDLIDIPVTTSFAQTSFTKSCGTPK